MNAGREHPSAVVTENAREDKALGKPGGELMKIYAIGAVGLVKV